MKTTKKPPFNLSHNNNNKSKGKDNKENGRTTTNFSTMKNLSNIKENEQNIEENYVNGTKLNNFNLNEDFSMEEDSNLFDFAIDFEVVNKKSKIDKMIKTIEKNNSKYSTLSHEIFFYLFIITNLLLQNYNIYKNVCCFSSLFFLFFIFSFCFSFLLLF